MVKKLWRRLKVLPSCADLGCLKSSALNPMTSGLGHLRDAVLTWYLWACVWPSKPWHTMAVSHVCRTCLATRQGHPVRPAYTLAPAIDWLLSEPVRSFRHLWLQVIWDSGDEIWFNSIWICQFGTASTNLHCKCPLPVQFCQAGWAEKKAYSEVANPKELQRVSWCCCNMM